MRQDESEDGPAERTTLRRTRPLAVGLMAGLALGDLLLGLNPDLLAVHAATRLLLVCAAAGLVVSSPFVLLRPSEGRLRIAGWLLLAVVTALFSLFVESQRTLYYGFLGNGARRVLVATTVVSLLASALAIARTRVASDCGPRFLAVGVALFVLPPFFGRRLPERSFLASPPEVPRTSNRSLLVVGLDGASWDLVTAGASDGSLPVFARLLREGAGGPLASFPPYDRTALWTTAATGKRPLKHGLVSTWLHDTPAGRLKLLPRVAGVSAFARIPFSIDQPADASSRRSLTFWEILSMRGHEAAVLNWPGSYPARPGLVLWATERAFDGESSAAAAQPPAAAEEARLFRVDVGRLDRPLARSLVPEGLPPGTSREVPLRGAARDLTVVSATLGAVPTGPDNVSALVLSGLAEVARLFGSAGDARYWGVPGPAAESRARALAAYYRFVDEALGDLVEHEGKGRTICISSPVGYGPPPALSAAVSFLSGQEPEATPDASRDGFLILCGSGIRAGVRLTSANVLDLSPTLIVLAGEPIARDMDGRVLAETFDERLTQATSIPIVTSFEPEGPQ